MAKSIKAPSLELLRHLRQSSTATGAGFMSTCARSKIITYPTQHRPSIRQFSSSYKQQAQSPAPVRSKSTSTEPTTTPAHISTPSSSSSPTTRVNPYAPTTHDRGPASEEDTQTDFSLMDIYSGTPEPATSIDACTPGGFHLNNGTKITGGCGVLLAGGSAWSWKPWLSMSSTSTISSLLNKNQTLNIPSQSLSVLKYLHPKPDLLIIGTGSKNLMIDKNTRDYVSSELGCKIDVMDTANASAAYNLLAKERGVDGGSGVGGVMLPIGWKGVLSESNKDVAKGIGRRRR